MILLFISFFNETATTEIYTLSLHDALPISEVDTCSWPFCAVTSSIAWAGSPTRSFSMPSPSASSHPVLCSRRRRSEEHTSELQSQSNLVCRLLLEKKKKHQSITNSYRTR